MDSEAELVRLMQTYGSAVTGLCTALLKDPHLAQDMAQETFVKAWRKMSQLRGGQQSEKAWLCRIAVNLCRDYQRTRWFRLTQQRSDTEQPPLWYSAPDEASRGVMEAVGSLSPRMREVILLHYAQNMNAAEIGCALGLSESAVYRRLRKARGLLKEMLEGWEDDE